ncbi:MAG: hypothetical protein ACYC3X_13565 [Pirellulaceae bacterium]
MVTGRSAETNRELADERTVRTFLERAAPIILESRTLEGERFEAVLTLADAIGLTREQLSCELRFLELRGVISSAPWDRLDAPEEGPGGRVAPATAPVEQAPPRRPAETAPEKRPEFTRIAPPPPPSPPQPRVGVPPVPTPVPAVPATPLPERPSPSESFRRWVQQKLAGYPSVVLATDDEQGLIGVGAHRYHLAEVLATHLVRDMVTQRDMRLERDLEGASCHSTVGASSQASSDEQKLAKFFEQVAPILSQHRGINAQSRVLLNAVAEQLGLSEEELNLAIRNLQWSAFGPAEDDPRQQERRESFRSYLRRALAQLPNGIVTFKTHRRLVEAGEHFHGVAPQWIKPTINEVAGEIGARFISQEQAIEHLSALIQDVLATRTFLNGETRARVYAEGTRWGLDPMDVEVILREHTERVRQMRAAEKRLTRWILTLTSCAVAVVGGGLIWLFVLQPPLVREPASAERPEEDTEKIQPAAKSPGKDPMRPAWWDEDLRIAAVNARIVHPDLKSALEQSQVADEKLRGDAYQQIVRWYMQHLGDKRDRRDMESLFTGWYSRDPAATAARPIPETLLQPALALEEGLPADAQAISAAFWGCRATAHMWKAPDLPPLRVTELANLLQTALGQLPEHTLEIKPLADQCVAALARRYYAALTRTAADDPLQTGRLYWALTAESADSLDDATLHRLDAELLAVLLPAAGDRWEDFRDIVRRTTRSDDSFVVLKMLDVFRRVSDPVLRGYLADFFSERLGAMPGSLTETELIDAIRKSIGVAAKEQNLERWNALAARADELITRKRVERMNPDVLLQETLDLTYLATLACALAQGEDGVTTFQEMETAGPARLEVGDGPRTAKPAEPFVTPYPVSAGTVIQQHIERLAGVRQVSERVALLRMIANSADTVPDIDPLSGQKLAEYLLQLRSDDDEQRQLLANAPKLARWNALRMGLADQLADESPRDAQRQDVLRALLGEEVDLSSEDNRQRVRRQLLQTVSATLVDVVGPDDKRWKVFDQGNQAMLAFYTFQAKLLRVPAETYAAAQSPAAILQALSTYRAGQLDKSKLGADEQRLLGTLPNELLTADFLAGNDLQYTVMLQRLWLQTLSAYLTQQLPEKTLAARGIVAETRASAAAQDRVFEAMRDLELGLLRLWLLYRPAGGT